MSDTVCRYRPRLDTVEAVRYRPGPDGNCAAVAALTGDDPPDCPNCDPDAPWAVEAGGYTAVAQPGEWIVRHPDGRLAVYGPEDFEATYEPVGGEG